MPASLKSAYTPGRWILKAGQREEKPSMQATARNTSRRAQYLLHAVFALTAVVHAIGGPLLPSLNHTFHLTDSESGALFLAYFGGTSVGALLCRGKYARVMTAGFAGMALFSFALADATRPMLLPMYLLLGVCTGAAMSAVSLLVGRDFPEKAASLLTLLNFSWSAGALAAPVLAAQLLRHYSYRAAYNAIAIASLGAAFACWKMLSDSADVPHVSAPSGRLGSLQLVAVFGFMAFLQVGIENTASVWLTTFVHRSGSGNLGRAAASSSLFWLGFLSSRTGSAVLLARIRPYTLLRASLLVALFASLLLLSSHRLMVASATMLLLGAAVAPVYPLVVAAAMDCLRRISDARYILATAGFGGSILPWVAGWISTSTGEIRVGMAVIPVSIVLMILCLRTVAGPLTQPG